MMKTTIFSTLCLWVLWLPIDAENNTTVSEPIEVLEPGLHHRVVRNYTRALPVAGVTAYGMFPSYTRTAPEETGPVTFLGIHTTRVDPTVSAQLGLGEGMGLTVQAVVGESPADAAGLMRHDILRRLNDQILIHPEQLRVLVRSKESGAKITLSILRGGKEQKLLVTLVEKNLSRPDFDVHRRHGTVAPDWMRLHTPHGLPSHPDFGHLDEDLPMLQNREHNQMINEKLAYMRKYASIPDDSTDEVIEIHTRGSESNRRSTILRLKDRILIFSGTVNSEEDRAALPDHLRKRLESGEDLNFEREWEQDGGPSIIPGVPVTIEYAPGIRVDVVTGTDV